MSSNKTAIAPLKNGSRRILLMRFQTKYHSMCPMGFRYHLTAPRQ